MWVVERDHVRELARLERPRIVHDRCLPEEGLTFVEVDFDLEPSVNKLVASDRSGMVQNPDHLDVGVWPVGTPGQRPIQTDGDYGWAEPGKQAVGQAPDQG